MAEIRLAGTKTSLFTLPDLEIDEFVPVVQFDPANSKSDALVTTLKGPKVELSPVIDEPLRTIETDILVAVPGKMVVTCTVAKGRKGTLDDDGIITPRLASEVQGVTVEALNAGRARYGEAYRFTVEIVDNAERAFKVELLANDDAQDANTGEFRDVLCGCVEVRTWPDVFSKADADRLIEEMEFIAPFAKAEFPKEYSEMYCMKAAERGLSVLLGNKKDFYSVDRSHNRLNAISHVGFGANDRGSAFDSMGFVHSAFESKEYVVDKKLLNTVKNEDSYIVNLYKMVSLPQGSRIGVIIRESCRKKNGFHVFYFSVSDGYHTLILLIDTSDESKKKYWIYDQDGLTSSHGSLIDLETGLERQTSWTFLSFYKKHEFRKETKTTSRLWKIQRRF